MELGLIVSQEGKIASARLAQTYYDDQHQRTFFYPVTRYRYRKSRKARPRVPREAPWPADNTAAREPDYRKINMTNLSLFFVVLIATIVGVVFLTPYLLTALSSSTQRSETSLEAIFEEIQRLKWRVDYLLPEVELLPNVALASLGADIVTHSASYNWMKETSFFCRFANCKVVSPKVVIQGSSNQLPGNCWSFPGEKGHITISLSHEVPISHVTLGHIIQSVSPLSSISSAPKEFSVYGKKTVHGEETYLGTFMYDKDGDRFQTFKIVDHKKDAFSFVNLKVNSNWGNQDHTCLYSFRVHGNTLPTTTRDSFKSMGDT